MACPLCHRIWKKPDFFREPVVRRLYLAKRFLTTVTAGIRKVGYYHCYGITDYFDALKALKLIVVRDLIYWLSRKLLMDAV